MADQVTSVWPSSSVTFNWMIWLIGAGYLSTKNIHFLFECSLWKSSSVKAQDPEELKDLPIEEGECVVFEHYLLDVLCVHSCVFSSMGAARSALGKFHVSVHCSYHTKVDKSQVFNLQSYLFANL